MWDLRYPKMSRYEQTLDTGTNVLLPSYDRETGLLFLAGKGDGNIRFFEHMNGDLHYLDDYSSGHPQRGSSFLRIYVNAGLLLLGRGLSNSLCEIETAQVQPTIQLL